VQENSSGSSSKAGGSSRYSGSRDIEDKYASRTDRYITVIEITH
jgi:hypothetical protein